MNIHKFFGGIIIFTGVCVMLLSGGCTLMSVISGVGSEIFGVVFLFAVIVFLIGLVIMTYGYDLYNNGYEKRRDTTVAHSDFNNIKYIGIFYLKSKFISFILIVFCSIIYLIWLLFKDTYDRFVKWVMSFGYSYDEFMRFLSFGYSYDEFMRFLSLSLPFIGGVLIFFLVKGFRHISDKVRGSER